MIADYFLLRKKVLNVPDLYKRGGEYEYKNGFNVAAIIALVVAVLPNVPGFLAEAGLANKESVPEFFRTLYTYAWFVGFLIGGGLHMVLHPAMNKPKSA